jgi:DNA-binding MarR family transcriptional regulator
MRRPIAVHTTAREIEADLRVIREILRRPFEADIASGGLTGPQVSVLRAVVASGPVRINDLSKGLKLAHSTLSVLIARLVKKGLISRQPDPDDGRAVRIDVTVPVRNYMRHTLPRRRVDPLVAALQVATVRDRRLIGTGVRRLRRLLEQSVGTR